MPNPNLMNDFFGFEEEKQQNDPGDYQQNDYQQVYLIGLSS